MALLPGDLGVAAVFKGWLSRVTTLSSSAWRSEVARLVEKYRTCETANGVEMIQ